MDLHQAALWKAAPDKKTANLEKHGGFELVPITGALECGIGQEDRESGEEQRLRTGTDYVISRRTQSCWHQVGVQNQGGQYLQGSACRARVFENPRRRLRWHLRSRTQAPEHPHDARNHGGAGLRGAHAGRIDRISQHRRQRGHVRQHGARLKDRRQSKSSSRHEASKEI